MIYRFVLIITLSGKGPAGCARVHPAGPLPLIGKAEISLRARYAAVLNWPLKATMALRSVSAMSSASTFFWEIEVGMSGY